VNSKIQAGGLVIQFELNILTAKVRPVGPWGCFMWVEEG